MSTIADMRTALAANISGTLTGWSGQVLSYWLSNPTPPTIDMRRGPVEYDLAMGRGLDELTFIVRALVHPSSDQGAQQILDDLVAGTYTLKAAIESDTTLAGSVDYVRVTAISDEKAYVDEKAGIAYIGAEWTVVVGVDQS